MKMIVAVDNNWAIGMNNDLLERIPEDQKYFREKTLGKVVIYGRKTLETFPEKRPLKDRINIILSSDKDYRIENAITMHSIHELKAYLNLFDSDSVYVIGGESIYRQLFPYCDTVYVTRIHKSYEADKYFPNMDKSDEWIMSNALLSVYDSIIFEFITYTRLTKHKDNSALNNYVRKIDVNDIHVEERQFFRFVIRQIDYTYAHDPLSLPLIKSMYWLISTFSEKDDIPINLLYHYIQKWRRLGFLNGFYAEFCIKINMAKMPTRYKSLIPQRVLNKLSDILQSNSFGMGD